MNKNFPLDWGGARFSVVSGKGGVAVSQGSIECDQGAFPGRSSVAPGTAPDSQERRVRLGSE